MAKKDEWDLQWQEILAEFTQTTGKEAPPQKLKAVFTEYKEIGRALHACTTLYADVQKTNDKKTFATFKAMIKKFDTAQKKYVKQLEKAIEAEKELNGGAKTLYTRALKVLVKKLDALSATLQNRIPYVEGNLKQKGVKDVMAKNLLKTTLACVKRARVLIARVKANPKPDIFNADIMTAARDINQNVGNIKKLRDDGYKFPGKISTEKGLKIFSVMGPWAGGQRQVSDTATEKEVLRELSAFKQMVDAAEAWANGK